MHLRTYSRKWWSGIFLFYILYRLDRFLMAIRECRPRSRSSVWGCFVCCGYRIVDGLVALVFLLKGFLHVEVELSLPLDTLLLHVADDTLVHSLFLKLLLVMDEDDGAGGEQGRSRQGELGGTRHDSVRNRQRAPRGGCG